MNEIKSLADELREQIKNGEEKDVKKQPKKKGRKGIGNQVLESLLDEIVKHQLNGQEKLLIRLDDRTVYLLKQLKLIKGIDMNKSISFAVKTFLDSTPELTQYIKESLKTFDL